MQSKQVTMIRGLVRAAELLEERDRATRQTPTPGEIWDYSARVGLSIAREYGWNKGQVGALPSAFIDGTFGKELEALINRHCLENGSGTPDFLLAEYLVRCLKNWNETVAARDKWHGLPAPRPEP